MSEQQQSGVEVTLATGRVERHAGASEIRFDEGHLIVIKNTRAHAIYAPGRWVNATVNE